VAVERGDAHPGDPGRVLDPEQVGVVLADPPDRPADLREAAVGQADLTDHRTLLAGQQSPDDLAFRGRAEHRQVGRVVEQPQESDDRRRPPSPGCRPGPG
jgi:hypothetical protein